MSAPTIPPRIHHESPARERPGYDLKEQKDRDNADQKRVRAYLRTGTGGRDERRGPVSTEIIDAAFRLQAGEISVREAWRVLEEGVSAVAREGPEAEKRENIALAVRPLVEVIMAIKRNRPGDSGDGPSIAELVRVYVSVGKSRKRTPMLRLLTATLEHLVRAPAGGPEMRAVLSDVVAVWVALFAMSNYIGPDGIRVPSLRSRRMQQLARGPNPFAAMASAAVMPATWDAPANVASALLATYAFVEDRGLRGDPTVAPIAPLLDFAERLMDAVWAGPDAAAAQFADGRSPLAEFVRARLHLLRGGSDSEMDAEQLHRRLSRGLSMRSADHVRQTWASLSRQIEALAPRLAAEQALRERYANLLDFCVCIWCALGREDVDEVLDFMRRHGFEYTVKTYTSMIEGWKLARQPRKIAALWERLERDGVPLDAVIWSARISALMTCGLEKPALRALHEMGQLWDAAVKRGDRDGAVKPEIGPVNAALAGVLRSRGVQAAPAILSWAARYDVEPDIATHNMLLRAMLHEGRGAEADALLRDMNARGVAADAATFTIIVEEVLGAAAGQSEERRLEAVREIFAAIEASGQTAKAATYAKMMHVLLENPGGEGEAAVEGRAVREVLGHMQRHSAGPTSHVFTIIADHLLARGNAAAVRDMISAWGLASSERVDGVFWEVVIRGFASSGLASEARDMFFALRRETRVALGVLDQLLVGLLEEGDVEGARALVREVRARMREGGIQGEAAADGGERFMRHRFWHVVAANGLDDV